MNKRRNMLDRVFLEGEENFRTKANNASSDEERQSYLECAAACERLTPKLLSLLDEKPTMQVSDLLEKIGEYPEHGILVEQRLIRSAAKANQEESHE